MKSEELLKELGNYLKRKGWKVLLIAEEGILKGEDGKKNSFRLSFKFIGNKKCLKKSKTSHWQRPRFESERSNL